MGMGMVGVVNGCSQQPAPAYGRLTIQEDDFCGFIVLLVVFLGAVFNLGHRITHYSIALIMVG